MYSAHPYFSLKNLGIKMCVIHSKIQCTQFGGSLGGAGACGRSPTPGDHKNPAHENSAGRTLCSNSPSPFSSSSFYKYPSFVAGRPEWACGCHVYMHWVTTPSFSQINPCQ